VTQVTKGEIKAKALGYFRDVERTGEPVIVTDRGKPVLEIRRYIPLPSDPDKILRGSVKHIREGI